MTYLQGAELAVEHLLALGHRRIGFLGRPPRDLESGKERELGYRSALEKAGIPFDPSLVRAAGCEESESTESARRLLQLDDRPTAVFAANDVSAIATMEVEMLLRLLAGETPEPTRLRLPTRLVERESCAPPPAYGVIRPRPQVESNAIRD